MEIISTSQNEGRESIWLKCHSQYVHSSFYNMKIELSHRNICLNVAI